MKTNPWLLPGAALLVTGGWIVSQKNSAATLEREITQITERIRQARAAEDAESAGREAEAKSGKDKRIDWKEFAGKMGQMRGGSMPDMRAMMRMQKLLLEMSAEELCVQLDEIAALDIEDAARKQLQAMIVGALIEKDPKLALERFGDEMMDAQSGMNWQLGQALGKWADKEPAAAAVWLDQRIAAGKFVSKSLDGKNPELVRLEAALVGALLKTDSAVATARVNALPEAQREELFQQGWLFQLKPETEAVFAKLVRDSMPADKVSGVLAQKAATLAMQGGFERVDGFITNAKATDDEKAKIVRNVMKQKLYDNRGGELSEESFEKARTWAATQSPDTVNKATGEALGDMVWRGNGGFEKASELALQYHESTGNDEVLAAFLKSSGARHRSADNAKALIDRIRDPELREEIRAMDEYKNKP